MPERADEGMTPELLAKWIMDCRDTRLKIFVGYVGILHVAMNRGLLRGSTVNEDGRVVFVKDTTT